MHTLRHYLKKAHQEHFAIGQFNFSTFEQVRGIIAAAQQLKTPIILGTSEGESKFVGLQEAVAMRDALRKKTKLPIFLNLDHGKSFDYLKEAITAGYDMVHFDGSKLSLEENIKTSREVVKFAKWRGVVVEGEVGRFGTDASKLYTEKFEIKEEDLTKPEDAKRYVKETGVDMLAVSIGTFHGLDITGISPNIRLDRLKAINEALRQAQAIGSESHQARRGKTKPIGLVLHGGSGTPEGDIKKAIENGIVKININTETRLAFSNALRETLLENKEEITPYKYLLKPIEAVQRVIEEKIMLFGSRGKVYR